MPTKRSHVVKPAHFTPGPTGSMSKYLAATDSYFQTLVDPFNYPGAKIPDLESFPSTTFQIVKRFPLTVNSNGVAGFTLGVDLVTSAANEATMCPFLNSDYNSVTIGDNVYAGRIGTITSPTASPNNLCIGASPGVYGFVLDDFCWKFEDDVYIPLGVPEFFGKTRLVSCGATLEYTGAVLDKKGDWVTAQCPFVTLRDKIAAGIGTAEVLQLPNSILKPSVDVDGVTVTYKPVDQRSLPYMDINNFYELANGRDLVTQVPQTLGNEFYLFGVGMTPDVVLNATIVMNFEAIPLTNQINIFSPEAPICDPISLSNAFTNIQRVPSVHLGAKTLNQAVQKPGITHGHILATSQRTLQWANIHKQQRPSLDRFLTGLTSGEGMKIMGDMVKIAGPLMAQAIKFL